MRRCGMHPDLPRIRAPGEGCGSAAPERSPTSAGRVLLPLAPGVALESVVGEFAAPSPRRTERSTRLTRRPRSARPAARAATQMTAATVARAMMRWAPITTPYSARTRCKYRPRSSGRSTPRMRVAPAAAAVSPALILQGCIGRPTARRGRGAGVAQARAPPPSTHSICTSTQMTPPSGSMGRPSSMAARCRPASAAGCPPCRRPIW